MKTQELPVSCVYTADGPEIRDVITASFSAFLRRELGIFTPEEPPGGLPE